MLEITIAKALPVLVVLIILLLKLRRKNKVEGIISFTPLLDSEGPNKYSGICAKWRALADYLGYTGPVVAYYVTPGFTFGENAIKAGLYHYVFLFCHLSYRLVNDKPTKASIVFFIPRLVAEGKNADEQLQFLAGLRVSLGLPKNHLKSFGSAVILAGVIQAYSKFTNERMPFNKKCVRSDTFINNGSEDERLYLGCMEDYGPICGHWGFGDNSGIDELGCFPVGVENIGQWHL